MICGLLNVMWDVVWYMAVAYAGFCRVCVLL